MENEELSYRYYQDFGLPFKGVPPLASRSEYVNQTGTCKVSRSGIFKVGDPTYTQAGRTFEEVLTRNASGEFQIIYMREYNNGSSKDKSLPPNLFVHVIWYEQFDVLISKQLEFIENGIKQRPSNSASGVTQVDQGIGIESDSTSGGGCGIQRSNVERSEDTGDPQREERGDGWSRSGDGSSGLEGVDAIEPGASESQDYTYRWDGKRRVVCARKETQLTQEE
jgi:hypothetical protein